MSKILNVSPATLTGHFDPVCAFAITSHHGLIGQ